MEEDAGNEECGERGEERGEVGDTKENSSVSSPNLTFRMDKDWDPIAFPTRLENLEGNNAMDVARTDLSGLEASADLSIPAPGNTCKTNTTSTATHTVVKPTAHRYLNAFWDRF